MSTATKKTLLITLVVTIALGAIGWQLYKNLRSRPGQIENATITALDLERRTAEIEFVHPRNGRAMRLSGTLAEGGTITLDGKPVTINDLKVGDKVAVKGTLYADMTVVADVVRAQRPGPATQPATQPATSTQPTMQAVESP